ncbi:helix-turn-helix domain-containing protein [Pedobacter sp. Du54]|uniref:GlxA family transcriptional regulator n=1 Tax=Pedobacter anseongensis TaxID=3133439 RepID=UPI0030B147E0
MQKNIAVLLTKDYKLLSVAAILEVFETVNKFYANDKKEIPFNISVIASTDLLRNTKEIYGYKLTSVDTDEILDLVLIPAFTTDNMPQTLQKNAIYIPYFTKHYAKGASIATVCTGAFLLAASGLLKGKIATTHVDACTNFAAAFPEVRLRADKTVTQDGRLYTSGGATSSFHLLLHIIHEFCGSQIAIKTAKIFAIDMDRDKQTYFSTFQPSKNHNDHLVASAQEKIENNYHDTATIDELIKDIPSSRRNIVRRFKEITGVTLIKYLQQTRIEAAKKLLERTSHQMNEVIFQSGYSDPKAFRKIFKKNVGMTPSQYRDKFQVR